MIIIIQCVGKSISSSFVTSEEHSDDHCKNKH